MPDTHSQGAMLHRLFLLINGKSTRPIMTLRTDYPPETYRARITDQIDFDRRSIFSFSGYRGKSPVLGRFSGFEFRLHKRRYWRNDFAPVLYGRLVPESRGTRVETYWGIQRWSRIFMRIWLAFVSLIGLPIFLASLRQLITGKQSVQGDLYVGLLVPPGMLLFGMLLPKLGFILGFREKQFLLDFLEPVLVAATVTDEEPVKTWESSLE